jgi:septal ring-binding cell division protein DamX
MRTTVIENLSHWQKPVLALAICTVLGGCATTATQTENAGTTDPTPVATQPTTPPVEKTTGIDTIDTGKITPQPAGPSVADTGTGDESLTPGGTDASDLLGRSDVKGEEWLMSQDRNAYTIQILSANEISTVKNSLPAQSLKNVALYKKAGDKYVLVYGIYANATEATEAIKNLPSWIDKTGRPFKISLRSVQASISER